MSVLIRYLPIADMRLNSSTKTAQDTFHFNVDCWVIFCVLYNFTFTLQLANRAI